MIADLEQVLLVFNPVYGGEEPGKDVRAVGKNGLVTRERLGAALDREVGEHAVGPKLPL